MTGERTTSILSRRARTVVITAFLAVLLLTAVYAWYTPVHRYGDSSTYFLQIVSLARDRDIQYTAMDLSRTPSFEFDDLPAGMELVKSRNGDYFYGKEFTYALFASPFFLFGGIHALIAFNCLLLFGMILMGWMVLRSENGSVLSLLLSLLFFILSTAVVYLTWIHPEVYAMFILMAALFFMYLAFRMDRAPLYGIAGILFGIAAIAKVWNLWLFVPFFLYGVYRRQWQRSALLLASFLVPVLLISGSFFLLSGSPSFYQGERYYFHSGPYPFQEGFDEGSEPALELALDDELIYNASQSYFSPESVPYILGGFFIGRFTGIFWYYPFTMFALLSLLFLIVRRSGGGDQSDDHSALDFKLLVLLGIIGAVIFIFLIRYQGNYFGGRHAIGNRYFTIYPAFLFLVGRVDSGKVLAFSLVAGILVAPVVLDPVGTSLDPSFHAGQFPYRFFPIEYPSLGFLPLKYAYYSDRLWLFELPSEKKTGKDFYSIEEDTQIIVVARVPRQNLSFFIYSETPSTVTVSNDGHHDTHSLKGGGGAPVTLWGLIPEFQESYGDTRFLFYSASISPSTNVSLFPRPERGSDQVNIYYIGWYPPYDWEHNRVLTRWMENGGGIAIARDRPGPALLSFELISFYRPREVRIMIPGESPVNVTVNPTFGHYSVRLDQDFSLVRFLSIDEPERPIDLPALRNNDTSLISIAIRNVTIHDAPQDPEPAR